MSYTPRKKVPVKIKNEARRLFESGMSMSDVAIELKLNIQTLYNISSKQNWEKGKLEELLYITEQELLTKDIATRKVERLKTYRVLTKGLTDIAEEMQTTFKDGKVVLGMNPNIALVSHAKALQTNFAIEKELYGIMSPIQEIELGIATIKYNKLKQQLDKDNENGDIEI